VMVAPSSHNCLGASPMGTHEAPVGCPAHCPLTPSRSTRRSLRRRWALGSTTRGITSDASSGTSTGSPTAFTRQLPDDRRSGCAVRRAPSIGRSLQRAADETTGPSGGNSRVTHLVLSHHHADHVGASFLFGDNVVRIGYEETRRILPREGNRARPAPAETFQDHRTLDVTGERIASPGMGPAVAGPIRHISGG